MPDENGIYPDYRLPAEMTKKPDSGVRVPWAAIYRDWANVVCDLAQTYHVHWHQALAWPWPVIRGYVEGLFTVTTSRVYRAHIAPLVERGTKR